MGWWWLRSRGRGIDGRLDSRAEFPHVSVASAGCGKGGFFVYSLEDLLDLCFGFELFIGWFGRDGAGRGELGVGVEESFCL